MKQIVVFCEGPTEQGFCNTVLQPHLFPAGSGKIHTLGTGRKNDRHVKGLSKYSIFRRFIEGELKRRRDDDDISFTTLIDLYGLPPDFPGKRQAIRDPADPVPYARELERAFDVDIRDRRFIPHLQLHEYETMLFAEPEAFELEFEDCASAVAELRRIAAAHPTIEHINDGRATAPSKRIIQAIPKYEHRKASAGPDPAAYIGLPKIRAACPHFDAWLVRLEDFARNGDAPVRSRRVERMEEE